MATFPMASGRRVMTARSPAQGVDANAFGMQSARAVEQLGSTVANASLQVMADQTREARIEADRKNQLADAADRQRQLLTLNETKDKLRDAHDEVVNGVLQGTIPKDQAETTWAERSKTLIGEAGGQFSEHFRDLASRDLNSTGLVLGNSVRKARETRDRQDVTSGIDQTLEYAQRQYRVDPAGAQKMAADTLAQLGPFSAYNPQQIAAKGQAWKEGVQFTQGYEAISAGRNDPKALAAAEKLVAEGLPDLDPQKRATLNDRVQAYRLHQEQQVELKAQRAQREWERRMTMAEKSYNVMRDMADKGTVLDPAYIDDALRQTQGTPYQAGIVAFAKQAKETGGFAAQPIAVQRATLQALDADIATKGRTPELDKRREQLAKVLTGSEGDLAKDGLQAGLERGVITGIQPLNVQAGIAGMVKQLGERSVQASTVQAWAGRPVSPLRPAEAEALSGMLASLPPEQKGNAIATFASILPAPQMAAVASQIEKGNRALSLAMAAGTAGTTGAESFSGTQTIAPRPVATLILKGQQYLKDQGKSEDKAPGKVKEEAATVVGDALPGKAREDVIDATAFIYLGMKAEGQSPDMKRAMRLAIGGDIVTHNGKQIPVKAGVTLSSLRDTLGAYPADELAPQVPDGMVYGAGQPVRVSDFLSELPRAELLPLGSGIYGVRRGAGLAKNKNGEPIKIKVN